MSSYEQPKSSCSLIALIQSRRSLFGYFCHRCFVSFTKLAIGGVDKLHRGLLAWLKAGDSPVTATTPGYAQVRRDVITNGESHMNW